MKNETIDTSANAAAASWISRFGCALAAGDPTHIAELFARECHWRDILAFTWDVRTASGAGAIARP